METRESVESTVRESTPADKGGIFRLREAVYGKPFDTDEYHWKFEMHSGVPAKLYVAEVDGSVVGLRAFIIERLKVMERVRPAGLGVDIMVHPDFRRYGIASQVANQASDLMEGAGVPLLVGFPNEAAFQVYTRRRSNWQHVCSIPMLVKPLNFSSILDKYIKNPLLRGLIGVPVRATWAAMFPGRTRRPAGLEVREVDSFDDRFDTLWEEISGQYSIQLVRDRAFLEWRFAQRPDTDYTILAAEGEGARLRGYAVLSSGEMFGLRVGFILDLAAAGNDAASALVRHALQGFREQNVDAAGCLMLPHTWQYKVLRRAGFVVAPKRVIHKEFYFGVQVKASALPDELVNRRESWFLTLADTDVA